MDKRFTVHVVPHTHWDREWYFTLEEFRYRLIKLMDRLLDAMERGAIEYFQMDGQTIMLEDYLQVRPENRERFLHWLYQFEYDQLELPKPDLIIYLDVPTDFTERLMRGREEKTGTKADIHEKDLDYLRTCRSTGREAAA